MRDLAPGIFRQRLVVEGRCDDAITAEQIRRYLSSLSAVLRMTVLLPPVTHRSVQYGWAGWIHWETSGAHFYAWDDPKAFFSVDIYTCKKFDPADAVRFTTSFFDAREIEFETFGVSPEPDERKLTSLLLDIESREDRQETEFGLYEVSGLSSFSSLARSIEREVFMETFGNDAGLMEQEYGPYESASTFVVGVDHASAVPAGMVRIIKDGPNGLKTLNDLKAFSEWGASVEDIERYHGFKLIPDKLWDVSTLAVRPDYRSSIVSTALYHGLYWHAIREGCEHWVAILDNEVLQLFDLINTPFVPICGLPPARYLDSPLSTPVILRVADIAESLRSDALGAYRSIIEGQGLFDRVSMPPVILGSTTAPSSGVDDELATLLED